MTTFEPDFTPRGSRFDQAHGQTIKPLLEHQMAQPNSAEEHKLVSSFEAVKRTLLTKEYEDRLDKPLAYWGATKRSAATAGLFGPERGRPVANSFH